MRLISMVLAALLCSAAVLDAADYHFDANGPAPGSGTAAGSYAWSGAWWSLDSSGASGTGTLPTRNTAIFAAGSDAIGTDFTITGASGEMGSVIVQEGNVTIQTLSRIFINGSTLKTAGGTSLNIQNQPDFYNNTIHLDTAAQSTLTLAGASSGVRNAKLVKTGDGLAIFNGANNGSAGGTLTVNAGEFRIRHTSALPDGTTIVNPGGVLSLANQISPARGITLTGGTLRNHDGSNSLLGTVSLTAPSTLDAAAGALNFNASSGTSLSGAFPLNISGPATVHFSKPLGAGTRLNVAGPGMVTVSAASPLSGGASLTGGTLRFNESSGTLGKIGGTITVASTLEVENTGTRTFDNVLAGAVPGRFVKLGGGALELSANSTFTGPVFIAAGTLRLTPGASLAANRIEIASGAIFDVTPQAGFLLESGHTLAGSGTLDGALTATGGSIIDPGHDENPAVLSFSQALAWSGGVTTVFDLAGTPAGSGDQLAIAGNLVLTGTNTVRVRYASLPNGTYPLVRTIGGTLIGDPAALRLEGFVTLKQTARLQAAPGGAGLDLVVEEYIHTPRDLVWTGDGTANGWKNGGSASWLADGQPAAFFPADRVILDARGTANPVLDLVGDLVPGSIRVDAVADYTFAGPGVLSGPASLLKSGSGTLIIESGHTFSGGTTITQGTIELRSSGALGSGAVENAGVLAFAASQPIVVANPVSGSGGIIQLSGHTTLTAANASSGPITVQAGTLRVGHPMALGATSGATTVHTGAALDLAGIVLAAEPVILAGGVLMNSTPLEATLAGPLTLANPTTLPESGPIILAGGVHGAAQLSVESGLTLGGTSTRSGDLTVAPSGNLRVTGHSGPGNITLAAGALLRGSGTLGGQVTVAGSLETENSPATLSFEDDLTLQSSALTRLRIAKSSGGLVADHLQVAGTLSRNGQLLISTSGLPLANGDAMQLLDAGNLTGDFTKIILPRLSNDLVWDTADFSTSGLLRVITLPAASTVAQRRQWLLHESAANPGSMDGFVMAAAWFELGEDASGNGLALSRSRSLVAKIRSNPVQVDLFDMWPAVDLCVRHGDKLDAETLSNIRESATIFTQYKNTNTSNLQTLAWVTRYLAGQCFGEDAFTSLGIENHWRANDPNAAQQLLANLDDCTRLGFREHASRPYYAKNLQPILSLAQLATDTTLRQRATLAYEAGLAQNAAGWLRGHLGTSTSRSYPDVLGQVPISSLGMLWYHFGGNLPPRNNEAAVMAAVMNQPVSPILETAATDRRVPFTSRSFLRNAHHSAYIDSEYILFSDGPRAVGNFQVYPNGVVWTEPDTSRHSFLWVAKPFRDDSGINSSNPHGRNLQQYKETQSRDAALYIYDIPDGDAFPFALGYVPGGHRAMFNESASSGHIFLHYGTVLIAIRSEIPFTWAPQSGIAFPAASPRPGDSEFRITGSRFALALETASPGDFPGATPAAQLTAFRTAVLNTAAPSRTAATTPTAIYTTRRGDALTLALSADPSTRPVSANGVPINYNTWPVLENPWMHQRAGGSLLTLFTLQRRELIDFTQWTRSVQTAPAATTHSAAIVLDQDSPVDIDLTTYALPAPENPLPLRFRVGSSSQGAVELLPDGRTARFTPSPGHRGPASFDFTASAAGVDPSRLVFLYDYESDFLTENWIADASGNRLTGILGTSGGGTRSLESDVPPLLAGISSRSLQLNANSSSAARFTHDLALHEHDMSDADWTFATWARRASTTHHDTVFYFGSGDGFGGSGDELYLFFPAGSDTIRLHHYSASNLLDLDLVSTAGPGAWHHLAVSFTRSGLNSGVVRLFLNGALAATSAPVTWAIHQSSPMVIGGNNSINGSRPERWFNGRLDDTALFNRVLSPAEISALATQAVIHFTGLSTSATLPLVVLTPLERWRQTHFVTTANIDNAADLADSNHDGEPNLLEFATGQSPYAVTRASTSLTRSGNDFLFHYTRSRAAVNEGCSFNVEWSDTLAAPWTPAVSDPPVSLDATRESVHTAIPAGSNGRRFVRIRIATAP